jgi:hypothetical protein
LGLKLNGSHQTLAYAFVYINLLRGNTDTTKKNTEILIDANSEVCFRNKRREKSKYMLLSLHQNSEQVRDIKDLTDYLKIIRA